MIRKYSGIEFEVKYESFPNKFVVEVEDKFNHNKACRSFNEESAKEAFVHFHKMIKVFGRLRVTNR